ncbi:sensor histidine kinase [Mycobacterium sp. 1274761.0]|uniref:sensor histidine kinase n=1 Tax=Mycobacterium sp. 1274761.0 TaxID=1834077 RepID=UPI0007FD14CB|nr:two-component sensor histidine kinase [Mycobacterium sp. 1274761.0]
MLGATARFLHDRVRRRADLIPLGYNWSFVWATDATLVATGIIAVLQRPTADLPVALSALALVVSPLLLFFVAGIKFDPRIMWLCGTASATVLLFATSTPIAADFAPLLLVMTVGVVGSLTSWLGGSLAALSASAVLIAAAVAHRLDAVGLYLCVVGIGWLVGFLMYTQQQLMIRQLEAQDALAEHAAADERRRIAREVHDVIAHSLSVTLLHITGARRGLQHDRDIDEAIEALEQAERLGRQAMGDIRSTVGLLDCAPMKVTPEPGVDDIASLIDDFRGAGLPVNYDADPGSFGRVSAAVGLALYRITQESLANIAKHAPNSHCVVRLAISCGSVALTVANRMPTAGDATPVMEGRGVRGMRQRVGLLGGTIEVGPNAEGWLVNAKIPLAGSNAKRRVVF